MRRLSLGLALGWMAVLFWLSSQPSIDAPLLFPGQDKLFHALVYGLLACLLLGTLRAGRRGYSLRQAWLAAGLASLYGITDELHQAFVPGRSADAWDWAADTGGALLAAWLLARASTAFYGRKNSRQDAKGAKKPAFVSRLRAARASRKQKSRHL